MFIPPWTPTAIAGEVYYSRPPFVRFALYLMIARVITALGLFLLATAPWWAGQFKKDATGWYIMGGGLTLLGGAWWLIQVWQRPPPVCLVLGTDRLQLQQGWADVIDEIEYRNIREVIVLRFPVSVGGGMRGLALRLVDPELYLSRWPHYRPRWQQDKQEIGYDWLLTHLHLPWEEIAKNMRMKMNAS